MLAREPLRAAQAGSARALRPADSSPRRRSAPIRRPTRSARRAQAAARGRDRAGRPTRRRMRGEIERVIRLPGGDRPRRAGPRRARAQRHGPVLRRADGRLRLHPERLGPVLRLALRPPADHLRRRLPAVADDRRVDQLRPVDDREAGQGDAHRAGDDARSGRSSATTSRSRRPASSSRWRSATRSRTSRRRASGSSRSTSPRSARVCPCAGTAGTST